MTIPHSDKKFRRAASSRPSSVSSRGRCGASGARRWSLAHALSASSLRGASATKQSTLSPGTNSGLLRCARNDRARAASPPFSNARVGSQTCLPVLAAASPELCLISPHSKPRGRREGRVPAAPAVCCAKGARRKPHSSIQVKPNTRPSLRDGRTAYAALSREPSSFWPPSPQRNSPAPAPVDATAAFANA